VGRHQEVPTRPERAYNAGETTQVPTGGVVGVTRRVGRKIGYSGINLSFERAGPARRRGGRATAKFDQKGREA
jgi:hypothetical protein